MTVALVANIARPISSAISTAFSADSYGALSSYGIIGGSTNPDAVIEALFANSEVGAWYDFSDLTTMFQDRAGTTPVTADGQTVGKILDKSGNDNHATAPSDAARPLYKTSGGLHWLLFDGVDDALRTANVAFNGLTGLSVVGSLFTSGNDWVAQYMTEQSGGGWWSAGISGGSSSPTGSACGTPTYRVNASELVGATQATIYTAQSGVASVMSSVDVKFGNPTDTGFSVGGYPGFALNCRIYSMVILGRTATTQEITDTETWVADKTGVTL
jgi:hypothetical protein